MKDIPGSSFFLILFSERKLYKIDVLCILVHFILIKI